MPNERTVSEVFNGLSDEQKNVVYFMIGKALEDAAGGDDEAAQDAFYGDDDYMMHNVFEGDTPDNTLTHADIEEIFKDAKRLGSLREAVTNFEDNAGGEIMHALYNADGSEQTYGIANVDYLFPDYQTLQNTPGFIQRKNDWVTAVMNGVRHTPFSRVKSVFANITMDEARAKGYMKGNRKTEEVFTLLKRTTDPQTVYKKQKMDRDDVVDITDFDVVSWLKSEMRIMLDEELARAILIGDGRTSSDDDKIHEAHIRPILSDDDLYTIKVHVTAGSKDSDTIKNMIRAIIKARKDYRGSGNLTFFTTEDVLSEALLLEDGFGHALYKDEADLARKLRVNRIVTVPVMENKKDADNNDLMGIVVDLHDYNVGADKGGAVNMFDDFDIDYNQQKYLIETRCSGALVVPFSAMAVVKGGSAATYTEVENPTGNPSAIPYYEKEGDIYVVSRDTTVKTGKTYYTKS